MRNHNDRPRKAVSFTQFRKFHYTALRALMSSRTYLDLPVDIQLLGYALLQALQEGRFADAVGLSDKITEQQYGDARTYRLAFQIANLVRKIPFKDPGLNPRETAIRKFHEAEEECRATNEALRPYRMLMEGKVQQPALLTGHAPLEFSLQDGENRISQLLMRARSHVRRVIGDEPLLDLISTLSRFSKGSVQGCSGNSTHIAAKLLADEWTCTPGCLPYAQAFLAANPYTWEALFGFPHHAQGITEFRDAFDGKVRLVEHDQIDFVPKSAKTERSIGKQASLNVYIQNGVGDFFREILRMRAGIDLRTAQDRIHGPLARLGSSCEGHPFATLDLKAASDTISKEFVKLLVPPAWFSFLDSIRSQSYVLPDGIPRRYEKFVAMGNGFCFGLETLLFWSLVQAVYDLNVTPDRTCAVYGDDIIVYQSTALELTELLDVCGFTLNPEKSFVFGPFRESCGQDYFEGINVRPFILDEPIEDWGAMYHAINSLGRRGFTHVAEELVAFVPESRRFVRCGPGPSNTALEVPRDVFLTSKHTRWNRDTQSFEAKALITVPEHDSETYGTERVGMLSALLGHQPDDAGHPLYALRYKTRSFVGWVTSHGAPVDLRGAPFEEPERRVAFARAHAHYREVASRCRETASN